MPDRTLRVKIIEACGLACTFCHNEGTPVATDNLGRSERQFTGTPGRSGRVSIYLRTMRADFLPERIKADADFALALAGPPSVAASPPMKSTSQAENQPSTPSCQN